MIRYAILEAPSNLGLRPTGVENSPLTLLELGLGRRLSELSIPSELEMITLADIRQDGFESAIAKVAKFLARDGLDGFWIHLDVDVLEDTIMPAVDYRMPNGLSWAELVECLKTAISSGRAIGMQVTIYNPAWIQNSQQAAAWSMLSSRACRLLQGEMLYDAWRQPLVVSRDLNDTDIRLRTKEILIRQKPCFHCKDCISRGSVWKPNRRCLD